MLAQSGEQTCQMSVLLHLPQLDRNLQIAVAFVPISGDFSRIRQSKNG
jgi:hypothetical protein